MPRHALPRGVVQRRRPANDRRLGLRGAVRRVRPAPHRPRSRPARHQRAPRDDHRVRSTSSPTCGPLPPTDLRGRCRESEHRPASAPEGWARSVRRQRHRRRRRRGLPGVDNGGRRELASARADVERSHRIDAEEFNRLLDGQVIDDARIFDQRLAELANYWNHHHRPDGALGGPVGVRGFEPPASTSRTWRANQAALHPVAAGQAIPPERLPNRLIPPRRRRRQPRCRPRRRSAVPWARGALRCRCRRRRRCARRGAGGSGRAA